ncbi:MAG: PD-(D/E)XK nuclease family protein [Elusimicrobia bacterium]|nr:PD-(D/E)XK nuclease family protein [Elusimicrobiota bacterium]
MGAEGTKRGISATMITAFLHYPRQFERRYIQGIKDPANGAMVQSKVWHATVEHNYRQKIASGTDLPLAHILEFFAATFDQAFQAEEIAFRPGETPAKLKDQGLAIAAAYHQAIAPKVRPLLVEERFRVSLGEDFSHDLIGVWDLVDQDDMVIDHKAFSRAPSQEEADENVQLGIYALAYRLRMGKLEKGLRLDVIVKGSQPRPLQLSTTRTNDDCRRLLGVCERLAQALQAGGVDAHSRR